MGSNFLIAGFIPSLAFVAIGMFAFGPVLPLSVRTRLGGDLNLFSQAGFISLLGIISKNGGKQTPIGTSKYSRNKLNLAQDDRRN